MNKTTQQVEVKLLHTEGCAAIPLTIDLIRDVAQEMGISIRVRKILVRSSEQATDLKFLGSPTVHINGLDIDPAARDSTYFGLM